MINRETLSAKAQGFSLIELIVVLAIVAVLTAIGYPAFQRSVQRAKINSDSTQVSADLFFMGGIARSKTAKVTMCPSTDGATCTGSSWNGGRIIFFDVNGDGIVTAGKDEILQVRGPVSGTTSITATGFSSGTVVKYKETGEVVSAGVFKICDTRLPGTFGITQSVLASGSVHSTPNVTCP